MAPSVGTGSAISSTSARTRLRPNFHAYRAFLALPEVVAVAAKAHPQVRAVVNRFALHAAALRMAIAAGTALDRRGSRRASPPAWAAGWRSAATSILRAK